MSRSRRHPPLFEALGDVSRRREHPGTGSPAPASDSHLPKHPVIVPASSAPDSPGGMLSSRTRPILFMIAAAIALAVIAYSLGFRSGESQGKQAVKPFTSPDEAAAFTGQNPNEMPGEAIRPPESSPPQPTNVPDSGNSKQAPVPASATPTLVGMPPISGADPRKPGNNYLHLSTLTWKDAELAVRYLQASGIRATAYPQKPVDPATAKAKNVLHVVIIADGVASSQFSASKKQCEALVGEVRKVGRRFKKEERGASDFADPFWALYRGE